MEEAVRSADPDRWERYLLRQRQEESVAERAARPETSGAQEEPKEVREDTPQSSNQEVDDEAEDLFRDLDEEEPPDVGIGSVRSLSACIREPLRVCQTRTQASSRDCAGSTCVKCHKVRVLLPEFRRDRTF